MQRRISWLTVAVLAIMFLSRGAAPASAEGEIYVIGVPVIGVGTPIPSVPYTITRPGFYYLNKNLASPGTGFAITIAASEVTLDLMGFSLTGPSPENGVGIHIKENLKNVEVRNGQINYFWFGIESEFSSSGNYNGNYRFANLKINGCHFGMMLYPSVHGLIMTGCQATGNDTGFHINATGMVIVQNTATYNSIDTGFDFPDIKGAVVINNVATNNKIGFELGGDPGILVDRNASQNNSSFNWMNLTGCTKGLNTP
jgi:hypothetical protein